MDRRQFDLATIRWRDRDGVELAGHPLPRPHAEALLQAFKQESPSFAFWLEVPPALDEGRAPGGSAAGSV